MSKKDVDLQEYIIPEPYAEEGTIWGGTFKLRNVIEGVLGAGVFVVIILMFPLNIKATALLSTILGIPMLVLGTIGLNNGPLSEFIVDAFRHIKSPRVYEYKALVAPEAPATEEEKEEKQAKPKAGKRKRKSKSSSTRAAKASQKESKTSPKDADDISKNELDSNIPEGFFLTEEVKAFDKNPDTPKEDTEEDQISKQDKIRMLELELEILKHKLEQEE